MEQLGVGRDDRIVVYDNSPIRTAARGWFMLRHFGARAGRDPRRRLPEVDRRGPADRKRRAAASRSARFEAAERARRGRRPRQQILAGARTRRCVDARGKAALRRQPRPIRAPASPPATFPAPATCRSACSTDEDGTLQVARRAAAAVRRSRSRSGAAVRRQLRVGRDRQQPDLRGAPARQRRRAALRRKLERMGRRSGDPESGWARPRRGRSRRRRASSRRIWSTSAWLASACGSRPSWRSTSSASMPAAVAPTSRAERRSNQRRRGFAGARPRRRRSASSSTSVRGRAARRTARPAAAHAGRSPAATRPRHRASTADSTRAHGCGKQVKHATRG